MGPVTHTIVAGGLGAAIWAATGEPLAVPVAIFTGVFTDTDHVLDFVEPREGSYLKYMTRPFHAWEFSLVGIAIILGTWYHPLFLAALVGYMSHLLVDQIGNQSHPLAYFVLYRASKRFSRRQLTPHLFTRRFPYLPKDAPLWAKVEPRIYRLYLSARDKDSSQGDPS